MKYITSLVLAIGLLAFTGCKTGVVHQTHFKDYNKKEGFYYALPKALFRLNVQVEQETFFRGPYHNKATLLGVDPTKIPADKSIKVKVKKISIDTIIQPDLNQVYKILSPNNGFMETVANFKYVNEQILQSTTIEKDSKVDDFIIEILNTAANIIGTIVGVAVVPSANEKKAIDAINKLNEEKQSLLAYNGYRGSKETLALQIKSIDKEISKLSALFLGKKKVEVFTFSFLIDPAYVIGQPSQKIDLLTIVPENGVKGLHGCLLPDLNNTKFNTRSSVNEYFISLTINNIPNVALALTTEGEFVNPITATKPLGMIYRVPGKAQLLIEGKGGMAIKAYKTEIPQWGVVEALPKNLKKMNVSFTTMGNIEEISLTNSTVDISTLGKAASPLSSILGNVKPKTEAEKLQKEIELLDLKQQLEAKKKALEE